MKQQTSTLLLLLVGVSDAWITPLSYGVSSPLRQHQNGVGTYQRTAMNAHWGADEPDVIDVPHNNEDSSLAPLSSEQSLLSLSAATMMGFAAAAAAATSFDAR